MLVSIGTLPLHSANRMFAATTVQKAQLSQIAGTKQVEGENKVMKSESVVGHSSRDPRTEIATVLAHLGVVMKTEVSGIVESCVAKIHDMIKDEIVETVVDSFEDYIHRSYYDSNEGIKSIIFSIVEQALSEVFAANRGRVFDEIQLALLIPSESIVKQIVRPVFSSTRVIVPMTYIVRKLVEKSSKDQYLKDSDGTMTQTSITKFFREHSSSDCHAKSKVSSASKSRDRREGRRRRQRSFPLSREEKLKSPRFLLHVSDDETKSDKSSRCRTCCNLRSSRSCSRDSQSLFREPLAFIQRVDAYF